MKRRLRKRPGEVFKALPESPTYLLSNHGRVISTKRNQFLKQFKNIKGYMRFKVGTKSWLTHIRVVELFGDSLGQSIPEGAISLIALGLSIDHLDNNRRNCRQANLEIVTHKENCRRRDERRLKSKEANV